MYTCTLYMGGVKATLCPPPQILDICTLAFEFAKQAFFVLPGPDFKTQMSLPSKQKTAKFSIIIAFSLL